MPPPRAPIALPLVAGLSVLIAISTVALAGTLWFSSSGGGFLPGLGKDLALLTLAAGNVACLILNGSYLAMARGQAPAWLWGVVAVQAIPALASLAMLANMTLKDYRDGVASRQQSAIYQAIAHDDVAAYLQTRASCTAVCQQRTNPEQDLLNASLHRAHAIADLLVDQPVHVRSAMGAPTRSLATCEGWWLYHVDALSAAVAHDDMAMLTRLLPISDGGAQRSAVWLAAQLDRLEMLQAMAGMGLDLGIRGRVLDENNTLVVAAASGAATHTARWLINDKGMPVHVVDGPDRYAGTAPLDALLDFATFNDSPRIASFLPLLVAHGVDLDAPRSDGTTWLQRAIRMQDQSLASRLVEAGADARHLGESEAQDLQALLAQPPRPKPAWPNRGCIAVGATPPTPAAGPAV